jgi:hypothetical protein
LGGKDPDTGVILNTANRLIVEAINPDRFGGFCLALSEAYRLVAFPWSTLDINWFLHPSGNGNRFMVRGSDFLVRAADPEPHVE